MPRPSFKIRDRDLQFFFISEPETPRFKNPSVRSRDLEIPALDYYNASQRSVALCFAVVVAIIL